MDAEQPVKRGPGRPRKHPLPMDVNDEVIQKKSPGRPRKQDDEKSTTDEQNASLNSPKKGRGRPRKQPIDQEVKPPVGIVSPKSEQNDQFDLGTPKKKRGRPPGSTKKNNEEAQSSLRDRRQKSEAKVSRISGKAVNSPLRFSPSPRPKPIRAAVVPNPSDGPRKRGRPRLSELPIAQVLATSPPSNGISENRRRRSPESSNPNLRTSSFNHSSIRNISKKDAIDEITAVYNGIPDDKFAQFHHATITGCYRLIDTDSDFIRDDSPRSD